jgi:hypothetical protein
LGKTPITRPGGAPGMLLQRSAAKCRFPATSSGLKTPLKGGWEITVLFLNRLKGRKPNLSKRRPKPLLLTLSLGVENAEVSQLKPKAVPKAAKKKRRSTFKSISRERLRQVYPGKGKDISQTGP